MIDTTDKSFKRWFCLFILTGVFLRLYRYGADASLWVDEAKLALNIVNSSFSELFGPLLNPPQFAPVGFVLAAKLFTMLLYENELTLRLLPLTSGILSLFLFASICATLLDKRGTLLAVALFSISERLVQYAVEFKPYSTDVFFALLIVFQAFHIARDTETRAKTLSLGLLGVTGVLALLFSYPAAMMLFVAGIFLMYLFYISGEKKHLLMVVILAGIWLGVFLVHYKLFVIDSPAYSQGLRDFWQGGFLPFPPLSPSDVRQYIDIVRDVFEESPLKLFYPGLFIFGFIYGCTFGSIWKDSRFALILGPIVVTVIVALWDLYPFRGRMILFLSPFFILYISMGFARILDLVSRDRRSMASVLIALLFFQPVLYQIHRIKTPNMEQSRDVLAYYQEHRKENHLLYVYYGGQDTFHFYKRKFGILPSEFIMGRSGRDDLRRYDQDIRALRGKGRVWFFFSHVYAWEGVDEEKYFLHLLDGVGKRVRAFQAYGASVYLYEL